jgi:hypothetical protein
MLFVVDIKLKYLDFNRFIYHTYLNIYFCDKSYTSIIVVKCTQTHNLLMNHEIIQGQATNLSKPQIGQLTNLFVNLTTRLTIDLDMPWEHASKGIGKI